MNYSEPNRRSLYRSRDGFIFGVCRGIADYAQLPVFWIRLAAVITFFASGFFPVVLIYIVAAIFMKPAPIVEFTNDEDWQFYQAYTSDRGRALSYLRRKFERLERRTQQMENIVTDRNFDWERRFDSGR